MLVNEIVNMRLFFFFFHFLSYVPSIGKNPKKDLTLIDDMFREIVQTVNPKPKNNDKILLPQNKKLC
jgi:hypothetical protein